ncbi:hypothetical protein ASZ90_015677 [hydrocarbon metagenome]|uniref:Thioesterase domain-containing protein n=1 Tax=hydrocarbon metagenome TaxID=938273 RepID=A0A0W8F1D3_9ZZZZ
MLHGGAIFALADHAFGLAANHGGVREVALSATIQYLSPATGRLGGSGKRVERVKGPGLRESRAIHGREKQGQLTGFVGRSRLRDPPGIIRRH